MIVFVVIIDYLFNYKFILSELIGNFFIFILILVGIILNNNSSDFILFDYLLIQNEFTIFIKNILIISLICCILISYNYISKEKITQYEYYILLGLLKNLVVSDPLVQNLKVLSKLTFY